MHRKPILLFLIIFVVLAAAPTAFAGTSNINTCTTLSTTSEKYILTSNVTFPDEFGSCFRVVANNIILDCAGYWIKGNSRLAVGVNVGANNFTMYNCTVTQFNQSLVLQGNHSWPMFHQNLKHTGTTGGVASGNVTLMWNYTLGAGIGISSPAIVDGVVYVGSNDKNIYAIWTNGTLKWNYTTEFEIVSSPAIVDGVVYVGSYDYNLYALYTNGTLKWNYTTGGSVRSSPAIVDGVVYVGSDDDNIYAIYTNGTLKWKYLTSGSIVESSPAVSDGVVYIGSYDNNTYAIYTNGTLKWNYTVGNAIFSSPAVSDGVVYIGSHDNNLYAFYTNGTLKWNYSTGDAIVYPAPTISDDIIYIGSNDKNLYAFYTNGTLKWNYTTTVYIQSQATVVDGAIYFGSTAPDSTLYALYTNGTLKWNYTIISYMGSPAVVDGVVYVGSGDFNLYAIGHSTANASYANIQNCTFKEANTTLQVGGDYNAFYSNYFKSADMYYVYSGSNADDNMFNTTNSGKSMGYQAEGNFYDDYYIWNIIDSDGDGFADSGGDWPYNSGQSKWFGSGADWGPIIPSDAIPYPFVGITPSSGIMSTQFNCTFNHTDANNNPATITAKWINGTTTYSSETFTSVAVGDNRHIFLRPALAHRGETWSCYVRACDAENNCGEAFKNVTIGNSKPSLYEPENDLNTLLLVHFDDTTIGTSFLLPYGMEGERGAMSIDPHDYVVGKVYNSIQISSALYYDNTNGDNLDYNAGTVEMWIKPSWNGNNDRNNRYFFDTSRPYTGSSWSTRNRILIWKNNNGVLSCRLYGSNRNSRTVTANIRDWNADSWHHVACTWDQSTRLLRIYVDGSLKQTRAINARMNANPINLHIGSDYNNGSAITAGIDEFRISEVARTEFSYAKPLVLPRNRTQINANTTLFEWENATDRDGDSIKYKLAIYRAPDGSAGQALNITYLNDSTWGWYQETGVIESVNDADDTITDLDKNWETNQLSMSLKYTDKINISGGIVITNTTSNNATTLALMAGDDLSGVSAGDTYQISWKHFDDSTYYWQIEPHDGTDYGDRSDDEIYFVIDAQPPIVANSTYVPDTIYNDNDATFMAWIDEGPVNSVWYGLKNIKACPSMTNYTGYITNTTYNHTTVVYESNFTNQDTFCFKWYATSPDGKYQEGEYLEFTVQNRAPSLPVLTDPANASSYDDNGTAGLTIVFNWTNSTDADFGNGCAGIDNIACNGFTFLMYMSNTEFNTSNYNEDAVLYYNGTANTTTLTNITGGTWYWLIIADDYLDANETNVSYFTYNTETRVIWIKTYSTSYVEKTSFTTDEVVVIRANVTDYNNYTDIDKVIINVTDPNNAVKVNNLEMTAVEDIENGRIFEYNLTMLQDWSPGGWTVKVVANDSSDQKNMNSTVFNVSYSDFRVDIKLYLNNTSNNVYIPGTGEVSAGSLGGENNYSSPTHYYISSYADNKMNGLIHYENIFRKLYTENTSGNHMIGLSFDLTNSRAFVAFTEGDWKRIEDQTGKLEAKSFMTYIAPSFAYGLGFLIPVKILLEYAAINIVGDDIIGQGLHQILLESDRTGSQKTLNVKRT
ncbi:MAG: PQQ-binding-like beta-propeller repeat protein [Nanoarchaeota archaeon]